MRPAGGPSRSVTVTESRSWYRAASLEWRPRPGEPTALGILVRPAAAATGRRQWDGGPLAEAT